MIPENKQRISKAITEGQKRKVQKMQIKYFRK